MLKHLNNNHSFYLKNAKIIWNTAKYGTNGKPTSQSISMAKNGFRDMMMNWWRWKIFIAWELRWDTQQDKLLYANFLADHVFTDRLWLKAILP